MNLVEVAPLSVQRGTFLNKQASSLKGVEKVRRRTLINIPLSTKLRNKPSRFTPT
jgi:hypothetical protein